MFRRKLEEGLALFSAGHYFAAHEAWEEAWQEESGERRALLQGLIQTAAGLLRVGEGRPRGATALLTRALGHLWPLQPACEGVTLTPLVQEVEARLRTLTRGGRADASPPPLPYSAPPPGPPEAAPPPRPRLRPLLHHVPAHCPSCAEAVEVAVEELGPPLQVWSEDCPVCCRPWRVEVHRGEEAGPFVLLQHEDA